MASKKQKKTKKKNSKNVKTINKKKIKKKKVKFKYRNIILFIIVLIIIILVSYKVLNHHIESIVIKGNDYLSDQEIIDLAGIRDYPKSLTNSGLKIKERLETNDYIDKVSVKKRNLYREVIITVLENKPLFYYQYNNKTILSDGKEIDEMLDVPVLLNQVPDTVYKNFIKDMKEIDSDVLYKMSEIQYNPTEVDEELFLLTMTDGNYVYVTLDSFDEINQYLEIVKNFGNKRGILHLDSGNYFETLEE